MIQFFVIVNSRNCVDTIERTLLMLAVQSHRVWRAVVVDDASTDGSADAAERVASAGVFMGRVQVRKNEERVGELKNIISACNDIEQSDVVCHVGNGDLLSSTLALEYLAAVYEHDNPACAWTMQTWSGDMRRNISGPLPREDCDVYKELLDEWRTSHLKTFRRSALDGISDANYRDAHGDWIVRACDRALYLPILHKAWLDKKKRLFLPLFLYEYNIDLNDRDLFTSKWARLQRASAEFIHNRGFIG